MRSFIAAEAFAVKRSGGIQGKSMWQSAEIRVYFMALSISCCRVSLLPLEPDLFVRRRIRERGNQGEGRLLHPWAHAANEPILPDRDEYDLVAEDLLDLVQHLLALLPVELLGLALEEILDLRQDAVAVTGRASNLTIDLLLRVIAA
jgi:hypothetical protein